MSHDVRSMVYRALGRLPWHGLGTPIPEDCSVEEAFRLANANFQAALAKVFMRNPSWKPGMHPSEKAIEVPGVRAIYRQDTNEVLGNASPSYAIIQPMDLASVWQRVLSDETGKLRGQVETVIVLNSGSRIIVVFKVPGDWSIAGEKHQPYLTATTSFDCSSNAMWGLTNVRTVCNNTFQIALGEWKSNTKSLKAAEEDGLDGQSAAVKVRHRGNVAAKLERVTDVFEKAFGAFNGYKEKAEKLAATRLSLKDAREILAQVIEGESDRAAKMREDVLALSVGGVGQRGTDMAGTAYGLLQGTTEYVDHHRMLDAAPDRRFSYVTDGAGSRLKQRMQATLVREYASATQAETERGATVLDSILNG